MGQIFGIDVLALQLALPQSMVLSKSP